MQQRPVTTPARAETCTLRPAAPDDVDAIATLWCRGWRDGHHGHVPDGLYAHRRLVDFPDRARTRLAFTTVAVTETRIEGFVTVCDDEVEQLYVDAAARGSGLADVLLAHAEDTIAARCDLAWLAVVPGNSRARRFYARCGWRDAGPFESPAETAAGVFPVPSRRYEKRLGPEVQCDSPTDEPTGR